MNVNGLSSAYGPRSLQPEQKKSGVHAAKSESAPKGGEKVELKGSTEASTIENLKNVINQLPETRLDMVEEIKEKIRTNDYPIETHFEWALQDIIKDFKGE